MAAHYGVSGTTWNGTGTTWAASSGGAPTLGDPTAADDVFLDASSASLAIAASATCLNLDCTGYTGTLSGAAPLAVSGTTTFKLVVGMGYTYTGTITFKSTSGTCVITTAGKTMANAVVFDGVGGTWQHADNWTGATTSSHTAVLTNGNHDVNGKTVECWTYSSSNSNTRTINVYAGGAGGTIKAVCTGVTTPFDFTITTGLSFVTSVDLGIFEVSGVTASTRTIVSTLDIAITNIKISGGSGSIVTTSVLCVDYEQTSGYSGVKSNTALYLYGSLVLDAANGTPTAGANILTFWTWYPAGGIHGLITTSGKVCDFPITMAFGQASAGIWLTDNLSAGTATDRLVTFTGPGNLKLNDKTLSCWRFLSSNSNTRALTMTGGSVLKCVCTGITTPYSIATDTGLTLYCNGGTLEISGVTASARTLLCGDGTRRSGGLKISGGSGTINPSAGALFFGYEQTAGYSGALTNGWYGFDGDILLAAGSGTPQAAGTGHWVLQPVTLITVNTNGIVCNFGWGISGTGTVQLLSNVSGGADTDRYFTIDEGTLDLNGFTFSCWRFASNNANTRAITFGAGSIKAVCTGAVTAWDTTNQTGLTVNAGTGFLELSGVTASTRTIVHDSTQTVLMPGIKLSGGSGIVTRTNLNSIYSFENTSGYTGTLANTAMSIRGPITLNTSITLTGGANAWTFTATSGTHVITSGTNLCDFPMIFDGVGGTWQVDTNNLSLNARALTLTNGTFAANNLNVTAGSVAASNSNTRTLALGTGTWTLSATGTAWDCGTSTGLTVTPGATGIIQLTSTIAPVFAGGGKTYYDLYFSGTSGDKAITGSNTFRKIQVAAPA